MKKLNLLLLSTFLTSVFLFSGCSSKEVVVENKPTSNDYDLVRERAREGLKELDLYLKENQ